ncbi:hypothetical protein MPSEU_000883400 [Mayamaea pseudoterrestris]|nr:hypothetical protein MPSEU_000883400 [Mayamaea pseudoterrestris]
MSTGTDKATQDQALESTNNEPLISTTATTMMLSDDGSISAVYESAASTKLPNISFKRMLSQSATENSVLSHSTPMDRLSDFAASSSTNKMTMKDESPSYLIAFKDRSNQISSPSVDASIKDSKVLASSTRMKRSFQPDSLATTPIARFSLADEPEGICYTQSNSKNQGSMSSKRRKKSSLIGSGRKSYSGRAKGRPPLALAGAKFVRSSAHFIGTTIQNALTPIASQSTTKKQQQQQQQRRIRDSMSPQKHQLPSLHEVNDIRKLIHEYTLLAPRDRPESAAQRVIRCTTGYILNPPLAAFYRSPLPARSPIHTRASKLEMLFKHNIHPKELDACKVRDTQLAEACTQCRYQREGYKYYYLHMATSRMISPAQYEERYMVMLQQMCKIRSAYWWEYFEQLFATSARAGADEFVIHGMVQEGRDKDVEGHGEPPALDGSHGDTSGCVKRSGSDSTTGSVLAHAQGGEAGASDVSPSWHAVVVLQDMRASSSVPIASQEPVPYINDDTTVCSQRCINASTLATGQVLYSLSTNDASAETSVRTE